MFTPIFRRLRIVSSSERRMNPRSRGTRSSRWSVIRLRRRHRVEADGRLDHDVAESAEDRVPQDAPAAGPPVVDDRRIEISRDDVGDLVLESLLLIVGEGHVVGIGADSQVGGRPRRRAGDECDGGAATSSAPVSLPRMECMRAPADPSEGEKGGQVLHPVPERVRSGTGALRIYLLRLVLPFDCLQPEHEQCAAALLMLM